MVAVVNLRIVIGIVSPDVLEVSGVTEALNVEIETCGDKASLPVNLNSFTRLFKGDNFVLVESKEF